METIEAALKAAELYDLSAFSSHLTPGFYMYDGGRQFDAAGIIGLLKRGHESGTEHHWHVTNPNVHLEGNVAWVAYVNDGSVETPGGVTKRVWLESAFLKKISGTWKVDFWHSTPVNTPKP